MRRNHKIRDGKDGPDDLGTTMSDFDPAAVPPTIIKVPGKLGSSDRSTTDSSSPPRHRYRRLPERCTKDWGYFDGQFIRPTSPPVPWRAIMLAVVLCVIGFILIAVGVMLLTGFIDTKYSDRTWPVLILGTLMFIPGAYHVRIAYCAYIGVPGYSYDDIPDFD